MTNLVKIEGGVYSFYSGKELIVKASSDIPMDLAELENYRKAPKMLKAELMGDFYKPRHYYKNVRPDVYDAMYYDGTDLSKEQAKEFGWTEDEHGVGISMGEFFIVKDKNGAFTYYEYDAFTASYLEF